MHPCTSAPPPLRACAPLDFLRAELGQYHLAPTHGLPRFAGGLVGYLGYEMMRYFEPTVALAPHPDLPDAILLFADTVVAFDHAFGKLLLITNAYVNGDEQAVAGGGRGPAGCAGSPAARALFHPKTRRRRTSQAVRYTQI